MNQLDFRETRVRAYFTKHSWSCYVHLLCNAFLTKNKINIQAALWSGSLLHIVTVYASSRQFAPRRELGYIGQAKFQNLDQESYGTSMAV